MNEKRTPGLAKQTPREFWIRPELSPDQEDIIWFQQPPQRWEAIHVREVTDDCVMCPACGEEFDLSSFVSCKQSLLSELVTQARETVSKQQAEIKLNAELLKELVGALEKMANVEYPIFLSDARQPTVNDFKNYAKEALDRARLTLEAKGDTEKEKK